MFQRDSHIHREVLLLSQAASVAPVVPVRRSLIKGSGCVLSISLRHPRQRVRASPSQWGSQGQSHVSCYRLGVLRLVLSLPHQVQGPLRSGAVSPHYTMS